jgi:6-phosphogluconolactonase
MKPRIETFRDGESFARAAADEIARRIIAASANGGGARFSIALSGGNTPRPVYTRLAEEYGRRIAWERVHFFWGDERYVRHDAPESNYRMAREALLDRIAIPGENIHPIPTSFADPAGAARGYEETLAAFFGDRFPTFDLNILGIGGDGHTASLFPGDATLEEREHSVAVAHAPAEPSTRITLTFPALERSKLTLFLAGREKERIVRTILEHRDEARALYPAAMLATEGEVVWMLEENST